MDTSLVQLGVNMYPVVQPAAQLLKVLRPACIIYYGLLLHNTRLQNDFQSDSRFLC